jgi:hypothetical protein
VESVSSSSAPVLDEALVAGIHTFYTKRVLAKAGFRQAPDGSFLNGTTSLNYRIALVNREDKLSHGGAIFGMCLTKNGFYKQACAVFRMSLCSRNLPQSVRKRLLEHVNIFANRELMIDTPGSTCDTEAMIFNINDGKEVCHIHWNPDISRCYMGNIKLRLVMFINITIPEEK